MMAGKAKVSSKSSGIKKAINAKAAQAARNQVGGTRTNPSGSGKKEFSAAYAAEMKDREERKKKGLPQRF